MDWKMSVDLCFYNIAHFVFNVQQIWLDFLQILATVISRQIHQTVDARADCVFNLRA